MTRKLLLALAAVAIVIATLSPWGEGSAVDASTAPPSPTPTYCYPIYTPEPGAKGLAAPMATELAHAETCGGQYGDIFSDGQFYTPAPTYTANSFSVGFPQNVFTILGRRVPTVSTTFNVQANATNYCYLDSSGWPYGVWNCNLLNTPPNPYSELMYTVTTNGAGVTAMVTPPPVKLYIPNLVQTMSGGNAGYCAIYNADGSLSPSPCPTGGGGGGVTSVGPGNCFSPSPTTGAVTGNYSCATPAVLYPNACTSPYATQSPNGSAPTGISIGITCGGGGGGTAVAGSCITVSPTASPTGGQVISFTPAPGCTPTPLPSPTSANANCSFSGVTITCITPTPGPTFYPTPTATSTACTYNGGNPVTIGGTTYIPVCVTPNPFEAALCGRADVTHCWTMHDNALGCASLCTPGPCPSTIADTPTGTANPSPVPLVVVTTSPIPPPTCNMPSIYFGGGPSIGFCTASGNAYNGCTNAAVNINSYLQIPVNISPAAPFTVFCVINNTNQAGSANTVWNRDSGNTAGLAVTSGGVTEEIVNNVAHNGSNQVGKMFLVLTDNGTATELYSDGTPLVAPTVLPSPAATSPGAFGASVGGTTGGFSGQLEDCGYANTAWSTSVIQYLYSLIGL